MTTLVKDLYVFVIFANDLGQVSSFFQCYSGSVTGPVPFRQDPGFESF